MSYQTSSASPAGLRVADVTARLQGRGPKYDHSLVPCSFCGEFLEIHPFSDSKNVLKCGHSGCQLQDNPQHYVDANNNREKRGRR